MSDWLDDLDPADRAEWDRFVEHVRRDALHKIDRSAFVISLVPAEGKADVKFAVELGLAIMLDKPIIAVVMPGGAVPERLRRVADEIVEADVDLEEGRAVLMDALQRLARGE